MRIDGFIPRDAIAVPDSNPPPPTGVMIASRSGISSRSSSAAVPCPAMTRQSSYGCTSTAPVSASTAAQVVSRASSVGAQNRTVAPRPCTAAFLISAEFSGITTHAGMPRRAAAHATAAPWLPDECVTTPRRASALSSENTALHAPRALNAPTFCRFSHLKNSVASATTSSDRLVSTGVRCTCDRMRACAAYIAARSTAISSAAAVSVAPIVADALASRQILRVRKEHLLPGIRAVFDRSDLGHEIYVFHHVLRRRREHDRRIVQHVLDFLERCLVLRHPEIGLCRPALVLVDQRGGLVERLDEGVIQLRILGPEFRRRPDDVECCRAAEHIVRAQHGVDRRILQLLVLERRRAEMRGDLRLSGQQRQLRIGMRHRDRQLIELVLLS